MRAAGIRIPWLPWGSVKPSGATTVGSPSKLSGTNVVTLTAVTPGSARARSSSCSRKASDLGRSYEAIVGSTLTRMSRSVRKPGPF